jgi:hypothetical protein
MLTQIAQIATLRLEVGGQPIVSDRQNFWRELLTASAPLPFSRRGDLPLVDLTIAVGKAIERLLYVKRPFKQLNFAIRTAN